MQITAKFIDGNDISLVEQIYNSNPKNPNNTIMTSEDIKSTVLRYQNNLNQGTMKMVIVFKNSDVYALYAAFLAPNIAGWIIHGPRVTKPNVSYSSTARDCAFGLDSLIDHMEQNMYFKFWQIDIGNRHLRRKHIMDRYSTKLANYNWYDEIYVPNQDDTNFTFYDNLIKANRESKDIKIRLYSLKQEFREPLITKYYEDKLNSLR